MISVIVLTYNRSKLLPRCIDSIIAQSFGDFELIIVDNGSSDDSGKIADQYSQKDTRISVIHREKGNIGSGRNAGLNAASGEYITFIDDDDYVKHDYLDFLLNLAKEAQADVAICGADGKEINEKFIISAEDALIKLLWRKYYNVQFPTKLIKRGLFCGLRFSETAKYDDIELMPKILAEANKIAYHGLNKYTFDRSNGDNNSAWTTDHSLMTVTTLEEYLDVYQKRTIWLCERFPDRQALWLYFEWSFMISMVEKITRLSLADCYEQRERLVNLLKEKKIAFMKSDYALAFEKEWMDEYV